MSRPVPLLVTATLAAATLMALAAEASAKPVKLDTKFSPHPLVTELISVKTEHYYIDNLGFYKCNDSNTTKEPAFTFELTEAHPELSVRFETSTGDPAGIGAVIRFPNQTYICANDKSEVYFLDWPKGTYQVWFYGPSIGLSAHLRFENPARTKKAVADARAKMPTIEIADSGVNPTQTKLKRAAAGEAADVGLNCAKARQRIMPLGKLEVAKASTFYMASKDVDLFIVTADDKCGDPESLVALSAGTHELWGIVPDGGAPKSFDLEIDDRKRPFVFPEATRHAVGDLARAMVIDGKVRAAEAWPNRGGCGGAAVAPDFYFTSDQPLQNVELSLLWGKKPMNMHVFGPIEKMSATHDVSCGSGDAQPRKFDIFEGTYAVWVGTDRSRSRDADASGADYHVLLRRSDEKVYPMTTFAAIPADLTMEERAIEHHYPYFDGGGNGYQKNDYLDNWKTMFTQAPDQMFVYPRTDITEDDVDVMTGEPLLVVWSQTDFTVVRRYDGSSARVKTQLLTIDRPATVWLPEKPEVPEYDSVSSANDASGPEDAATIDAYFKQSEKFDLCYGNYMEKNDPTWGTGTEVYKISGSGRVVNVGSEVSKRAESKCGWSKLEKAGDKLLAALAKTRTARYQARLAAVRQRFSLP